MTATIVIGNTDNKLTQQEWAEFIRDLRSWFGNHKDIRVQFSGCSTPCAPWQNFCLVVGYTTDKVKPEVISFLDRVREKYRQESIAYIEGECKFIGVGCGELE